MTVMHARAHEVLRQLAALPEDHEDADLLVEGWRCYFGTEPIHRNTVNELIRATAIRRAYDDGPYWIITPTGRAIARRPELADEVFETILLRRGAFTIRGDRVVPLDD